jgi:hypothetical protein
VALGHIFFLNSDVGYTAGGSGVILKTTNGGLPFEFVSFKGKFNQKMMTVSLNWQTATETNNYGFEVERAVLDKWQKIGIVKGSGTITVPQKYTFIDSLNTIIGQIPDNLKYCLKQIDFGGAFEYSPEIQVTISQKPLTFNLNQNYPNPFNPTTKIKFEIPKLSYVRLTIYDMLGREITTLVNENLKPGRYELSWDAIQYASGVYFYKIEAGSYVKTKKML